MKFPLCLASDIKPTVKSFLLRFQLSLSKPGVGVRGTLGISGWGCAAGNLEPLTYTRAS